MNNWTVYALVDPHSGIVRYVGVTCSKLETRLRRHYADILRYPHHDKCKWIEGLRASGLLARIEVLETGCGDHWKLSEEYWIAHYRDKSDLLTNVCRGGQLPGDKERRAIGEAFRKGKIPRADQLNVRPKSNKPIFHGTSAYRGVIWTPREDRPWLAFVKADGEERVVGHFADEKQAALAYNEAMKTMLGERCWSFLNNV